MGARGRPGRRDQQVQEAHVDPHDTPGSVGGGFAVSRWDRACGANVGRAKGQCQLASSNRTDSDRELKARIAGARQQAGGGSALHLLGVLLYRKRPHNEPASGSDRIRGRLRTGPVRSPAKATATSPFSPSMNSEDRERGRLLAQRHLRRLHRESSTSSVEFPPSTEPVSVGRGNDSTGWSERRTQRRRDSSHATARDHARRRRRACHPIHGGFERGVTTEDYPGAWPLHLTVVAGLSGQLSGDGEEQLRLVASDRVW
jgi:hypothetical protein